jgi:hypothetical protein
MDRLAGRRLAPPAGHVERVDDELGSEVIGDRPADDEAAPRVDHHRAVDASVAGWVLGDVGDPQPVRSGGLELADDQIIGRDGVAVASCAALAAPAGDALELGVAHEALHPLAADADVLAEAELGVHPRAAIGATGLAVNLADGLDQLGVLASPLARVGLPLPPLIEPGGRDAQDPAAHCDREP